jgi:pimeloyl-ACP methyl ester carboxylesterase
MQTAHASSTPPRQQAHQAARAQLIATLPVSERHLRLAGIPTAVLEGGEGPPMVLLHGPAAHAAHWMRVIPGLVASRRVIAPDLPGHGASEAGEQPLDTARMLDWLGELIDRTCASPPTVVGQTLGGAIAARFASRHPGRLKHLVLVDTFGLAPFAPPPDFALAVNAFLAQPTQDTHERLWRQCAFDLDTIRQRMGPHWDPFVASNLERARSARAEAALHALMECFALPAIAPGELQRITAPVTLVWGRHDRATPLAAATAAGTRFGWPLHVIDDCSVDAHVEQPQALLRVLLEAQP